MVLPVYQNSEVKRFWDHPNLWREAWENNTEKTGLVPFIYPQGDLRDIGLIDADQALNGDYEAFSEIAKLYKTSSIAVVHAILSKLKNSTDFLEVFIAIHAGKERTLIKPIRIIQEEGEGERALLERSVKLVVNIINNKWKEANLLDLKQSNIAAFTIPITGLNDWLFIETRLRSVFLISRIEMVLLSLDEVRINVHYRGEMRQLEKALNQSNLSLVKEDSELVLYTFDKD